VQYRAARHVNVAKPLFGQVGQGLEHGVQLNCEVKSGFVPI
jgi:hypothetical protein